MKTFTIASLIIYSAAILAGAACAGEKPQTQQSQISFGVLPKNYQTMVRGYYSMPGRLLDPFSAVYRFETPHKASVKDGIFAGGKTHYGWAVPVWINAKNAFGGYTGYQLHAVMFFSESGKLGDVTEFLEDHSIKFFP